MEVKTKKLFKLWGKIWWTDKKDCRNFIFIPENEAIFRWAETKEQAVRIFKEILRAGLRKKKFNYPAKPYDIYLYSAKIEVIKFKRGDVVQKQKNLPFPQKNPD